MGKIIIRKTKFGWHWWYEFGGLKMFQGTEYRATEQRVEEEVQKIVSYLKFVPDLERRGELKDKK